jgi:hypothetical protein
VLVPLNCPANPKKLVSGLLDVHGDGLFQQIPGGAIGRSVFLPLTLKFESKDFVNVQCVSRHWLTLLWPLPSRSVLALTLQIRVERLSARSFAWLEMSRGGRCLVPWTVLLYLVRKRPTIFQF